MAVVVNALVRVAPTRSHPRTGPPQTAAPGQIGLGHGVAHHQILGRIHNRRPFEPLRRRETRRLVGVVGVHPEKECIVTIAHQVAIELPRPTDPRILALALKRMAAEVIRLPLGITHHRRTPPIRPRRQFIRRGEVPIPVTWKHLLIFIRVQLHEERDLLQIVHARDGLPLRLSLAQGWKKHAGQNGYDRNDHQEFDQREGRAGMEIYPGFHGIEV